ncbi:carbamoyl phosphate synthase large subunit, partial [Streptomyces rhizosphaericola]
FPARELVAHGFELMATSGTAEVLKRNGINATIVRKQSEGTGPNGEKTIVQHIHDGEVDLIVNTPYGTGGRLDGYEIRTAAVARSVPCLTTVQALAAAVQGIDALNGGDVGVRSLQEHAEQLTEMTSRDQLDPVEGIEVSRATETARRASAVPIM